MSFLIGFDADDTLWHNETIFSRVHERYRELLAHYHDAETVERTLLATERRNLDLYGYGVKGFTLSAIETAIGLTDGRISAAEIAQLIALGREMLAQPVELLDGVQDTLRELAERHQLLVITKGDLRDQQRKFAQSGLEDYFRGIEVVTEKDERAYLEILQRRGIAPERFIMVGNSLKSDILPVLALGGAGVHVPYHLMWELEKATAVPESGARFFELEDIRAVPQAVATWVQSQG